ncbi:MAG TPA: M23 family metallopeptidase [Pilimelia sp.]|nr:M23 family metallopeptidase [Pilimelia sp.]
MSRPSRLIALAATLLLIAVGASPEITADIPAAGRRGAADDGDPHVEATVLAAPRPVPATDTRLHLVYEVLLRNGSSQPVQLDHVEVRDPDRRDPVATYGGRAIGRVMSRLEAGGFTRTLGPGQSGVLLLDVALSTGAAVPTRLTHRFGLSVGTGGGRPLTTTGAQTTVDQREPVRVGPPLAGGDLGVLGCCGPPFSHRLALLEIGGRIFAAQRYAIDFVRWDDGLSTFAGDPARNESYFIFGDEVTAVAPGRVVAARDGVPENTPPSPPADPTVDDLAGNFVIQDIGGGHFALYAHLQVGSVRVKPGDRLDRGQPLGRVGNTGNSSEPHLHFHVTDGPGPPSALAADGVPYLFDHLRLTSRVVGLDSHPRAPVPVPVPPPHRRAGQYPLTGDVLAFEPV